MSPSELELALKSARQLEVHDYRNDDDEDDYISAVLYAVPDDRAFRLISSSGMNSKYCGAGNFGEWLTSEERAAWRVF